MANFNPTTGKWTTDSGAEFGSRYDTQARENMMGGNGPAFQDGILGALWKFFCLIPRLMGLAVGGLCGLLLKLGVAGKVILTALAAFGALIILGVTANELGVNDHAVWEIVVGIIVWAAAIAVGVWFWIWHYKVVKQMPYRSFITLTTQCMMILFWGTVVLAIIFALSKKLNLGLGASMGISLVTAIIWWLFKANKYKASDTGSEQAASISDPVPTPAPSEENRCAVGDLVWARWSQDGNLYFAGIAASSDAGIRIVYYDGTAEQVGKKDIFYLSEAQKAGLTPHGNWQNKGDFYPCDILESNETSALVRYTEDKVKEQLPYYGLVFMK